MLICDGFGTHETLEVLEHCFADNIILCRLPSHTSHKLQPCDIAVFAPLKAAYRDNIERMERGGVNTIGKQHFTSLYSPARQLAFSRRNIVAGWSKGGLFPFNPHRVLRDIEKPINATSSTSANAEDIATPYVRDATILSSATPVTPVTAEGFALLQEMLIRDARMLGDEQRSKFEGRLQKLTKGAQTSIARNALQEDRINFLHKINNEARVRRSTKSIVLGKAKVISFEDLEAARAKRDEKEAKKSAKKKQTRGRKRKGTEDADHTSAETGLESSEIYAVGAEPSENSIPPCPGKVLVARMW